MEILKLKPAIKDYIWGGTKLKDIWGKDTLNKERIAESWELSVHDDGLTLIDGGSCNGQSLKSVLDKWGKDSLGQNACQFEMFPQLIKLIDAKESLSIQVHPNDEYALKNENQYGKTEVWYIADAEEGAGIYWGFKHKISKQEFRLRIENNTLLEVLQFIEAKKGDVFFIEAGTIHAICKGLTLAEIQQNSNITYRVYDYGRVGAGGKQRELHIDKAIEVTNTEPPKIKKQVADGKPIRFIADCKYFKVNEFFTNKAQTLKTESDTFNAILFLEGEGQIRAGEQVLSFKKGETFFVPAGFGVYFIVPKDFCRFLLSKV